MKKNKTDKKTIYLAASLFSGRETYFNATIAKQLERNYNIIMPQRDGFEFGNLAESLQGKLPEEEIGSAVQDIIYHLDMGVFVNNSDIILANLDEPLDEGVVVEMSYAKLMGKKVIGFRTDVRAPYGNIEDPLKGMHFFPAYQCDYFISAYMPCKNLDSADNEQSGLIEKVNNCIDNADFNRYHEWNNPLIQEMINNSEILFKGINDVHSQESLELIAQRYIDNKDIFEKSKPKIISA
ncbi:hypothetical protein GQ472_02745 [archaeon]|nr:hypothetical protein [archaeon]